MRRFITWVNGQCPRIKPYLVLLGVVITLALFGAMLLAADVLPTTNDEALFIISDSEHHTTFTISDEAALRPGIQIFFHHDANGGPVRLTNPQPEKYDMTVVDWATGKTYLPSDGTEFTVSGPECGVIIANKDSVLVNRAIYIDP